MLLTLRLLLYRGRRAWAFCHAARRVRLTMVVLAVLTAPLALKVWHVALGGNSHTIVPGAIYRSARPEADQLRRLARRHELRTVVNLEGDSPDDWHDLEHALGAELGVRVLDVGIWACSPPSPQELRLLVETLADAPGPILIHCRSGCDRSGLASALALLLRTEAKLDVARRQLSLYYGHNPLGRATCLDRVLDEYEAWLGRHGLEHQPSHLRQWARRQAKPRS